MANPTPPLRNRVRYMCERMGWSDKAISLRVGMAVDELLTFRRRHGIVHITETPEFAASRRAKAERAQKARQIRREQREAARLAQEAAAEEAEVKARRDRWSRALAGRAFEDASAEPAVGRLPRVDISNGLGRSSMAYA